MSVSYVVAYDPDYEVGDEVHAYTRDLASAVAYIDNPPGGGHLTLYVFEVTTVPRLKATREMSVKVEEFHGVGSEPQGADR
ncbi:MAG TPA: hypothetical protein VIY48_07335 [Candidatus Paceibacterota bacterium]